MSKKISPKMFLSYVSRTKQSADGFLTAYEKFLTTGELADKTSPILSQVRRKDISAEIGLKTINNICTMHVLKQDELSAEKAILGGGLAAEPRSSKPISATIFTVEGEIATHMVGGEEKPLVAHFDHPQQAERWVWNKLDNGEHDWYGETIHSKVTLGGFPMKSVISREDALRGLKKTIKVPYMHQNKVSVPNKQKMKVTGKSARFSGG